MQFRQPWFFPLALVWLLAATLTDLSVDWRGGEGMWYLPAVWLALSSGSSRRAVFASALGTIAIVIGAGPWHDPFPGALEWSLRIVAIAAAWGTLAIGLSWQRLHKTLRETRETIDRLQADNENLREQAQASSSELSASRLESSERQAAVEQALRDSETLYHSLVDHLPLSVLRKDATFRYTFINRRFVEFSGKPPDELIGRTDFDLFPADLAAKYRQGDEQVLSTGNLFEDIETYRKPDGEERFIQVLKMPIRDSAERIIGTQVMFWDVTDRKRAENALEQSARELEERNAALEQSRENLRRQSEILESILRSIADGVVVADEQGQFLVWNPAAERIIGMGPENLPTSAWTSVYGLFQTDRTTPFPVRDLPLARAIRGEDVSDVAMFIRNDHKSEGAFLSLNATPLRDAQGHVRGGVAVFRDVTRQHVADEALRKSQEEIHSKNQDLETLLYVTSHDLREPLRAIENFSKLVRDRYSDRLDATGRDFLERVVKGAQRLDLLLEDVLTLSRVERAAQPASSFDSTEVVEDVLRHLETRIRETHARVEVVRPLPQIRADRRWAAQAVQNLVSNALKYVREGEPPQVEIRAYEGAEGTGLAVCDRGLGVPPAYTERIFGLFQRAVHRNIEGTGAGLAIVRRVAERHGGRAWVRSREGGGSEFIITFGPGAAA